MSRVLLQEEQDGISGEAEPTSLSSPERRPSYQKCSVDKTKKTP